MGIWRMLMQITILVLAGLMIAAAFYDATSFTIPNWLSGLVILTFPVAALAAGLGWARPAIICWVASSRW